MAETKTHHIGVLSVVSIQNSDFNKCFSLVGTKILFVYIHWI